MVTAVCVVALLAFDTPITAVAGFIVYIVAFTLVPGLAAWTIVTGRLPTDVRDLALGWALGFALELGAYVLCAALGVRGLFVLEPVVVVGAAAAVWVLRSRRGSEVAEWGRTAAEESRGWLWALGVLLVVLVAYVVEG